MSLATRLNQIKKAGALKGLFVYDTNGDKTCLQASGKGAVSRVWFSDELLYDENVTDVQIAKILSRFIDWFIEDSKQKGSINDS